MTFKGGRVGRACASRTAPGLGIRLQTRTGTSTERVSIGEVLVWGDAESDMHVERHHLPSPGRRHDSPPPFPAGPRSIRGTLLCPRGLRSSGSGQRVATCRHIRWPPSPPGQPRRFHPKQPSGVMEIAWPADSRFCDHRLCDHRRPG